MRLVVWKIFGDTPEADGEYYVDTPSYYGALQAAADAGLSSLNLSIGGFQRAQTENLLIQRLIRSGVTVCAAMGNEFQDGNPTEYPAAFDDVVSVGSIAEDQRRSAFSNTGRTSTSSRPARTSSRRCRRGSRATGPRRTTSPGAAPRWPRRTSRRRRR